MSCAAAVARKLGAGDLHATMVSGFAGGLGLCGGACGALGAALWILGMRIGESKGGKVGYNDPRIQEVIDRFQRHTAFRFECSQVAGRSFQSVADHSAYLRNGGCQEVMAVLTDG